MLRVTSSILLGLVLALPLTASAGESDESKGLEVAAVANADATSGAASRNAEDEGKAAERTRERRSEVRGSRVTDPGVRFNNPYAFPLQTLPLALPNIATINF